MYPRARKVQCLRKDEMQSTTSASPTATHASNKVTGQSYQEAPNETFWSPQTVYPNNFQWYYPLSSNQVSNEAGFSKTNQNVASKDPRLRKRQPTSVEGVLSTAPTIAGDASQLVRPPEACAMLPISTFSISEKHHFNEYSVSPTSNTSKLNTNHSSPKAITTSQTHEFSTTSVLKNATAVTPVLHSSAATDIQITEPSQSPLCISSNSQKSTTTARNILSDSTESPLPLPATLSNNNRQWGEVSTVQTATAATERFQSHGELTLSTGINPPQRPDVITSTLATSALADLPTSNLPPKSTFVNLQQTHETSTVLKSSAQPQKSNLVPTRNLAVNIQTMESSKISSAPASMTTINLSQSYMASTTMTAAPPSRADLSTYSPPAQKSGENASQSFHFIPPSIPLRGSVPPPNFNPSTPYLPYMSHADSLQTPTSPHRPSYQRFPPPFPPICPPSLTGMNTPLHPAVAFPNTSIPPPNYKVGQPPPFPPRGSPLRYPPYAVHQRTPRGPRPSLYNHSENFNPNRSNMSQNMQRPLIGSEESGERITMESSVDGMRRFSSSNRNDDFCKDSSVTSQRSRSSRQSSQESKDSYRKRSRSPERESREKYGRTDRRGFSHRRSPPRSRRDDRRSRSREYRRRSRTRSRERRHRSRSNDSRRPKSRDRSRRSRSYDRKRSYSRDRYRRSRSRSRRSRSSDWRRSHSNRWSDRRSPGRTRGREKSGREQLIEKWRRLNCKDDKELERRLLEISRMDSDQLLKEQSKYWIRCAPATTYYERDTTAVNVIRATIRLDQLCKEFERRLIEPGRQIRMSQAVALPQPTARHHHRKCHHHNYNSCSSDSEDEEQVGSEESQIMEELERKMKHPYRLHRELWYNEPGQMNDGPLCKCSIKARRSGIRHGIYAGEAFRTKKEIKSEMSYTVSNVEEEVNDKCSADTNNAGRLHHYRITISPPTNFLSKTPTIISHDGHEFIFEGFSLFSHYPLPKLPVCKVIRFNIEYIILYAEESYPENFTIRECDLFFDYLFGEILELVDLDLFPSPESCPVFHFMPRFVRELDPEGHELLPMCLVLKYLISSYKPLVPKELLPEIPKTSTRVWQDFAEGVKGMIVTKPGMKPSSIRVDQLDKDVEVEKTDMKQIKGSQGISKVIAEESCNQEQKEGQMSNFEDCGESSGGNDVSDCVEDDMVPYPEIIHFGIRPPQLSYAGNQEYQKAWREYVKHRHLIANLAKPTREERQRLAIKEAELLEIRTKTNMKRDVTATLSSEGFFRTGLMCDVVQHAMLIPVLACHLRFHRSLDVLEKRIGYVFKNRSLLQLALTHPSYRENFGTNPDHARNSLTNCGIRQPEYGDRRIHYISTKKRGINTLMSIMSRFGSKTEEESNIYHNERLEFLGDAVVEFVSTIHLFHIFPDLEEGGLATYRAALVQNQHLAVLAKVLSLDAFLLYAHGSDLCHDLELNHALANCFEALMGALFLDGSIQVADHVFGQTVFGDNPDLFHVWESFPPHPLICQEPDGDRHWIKEVPFLQELVKFEQAIGVEFTYIRILARAFTDRSVGYTNLTMGSNQRLEFLGDSVLQLVASEYLYKHFPDHHEGHLSLLRSSLVNNNTQSVVCDDLGMTSFARYAATKGDLKIKDKADLLEAFLGALYIDTGSFEWVEKFCEVCFFPRLQDFIMNQEWNDPKSKLQQCCLTLRTADGGEPDIPCYKVVESKGPTNTRMYSVAVYFRGKRMATASGHSIQQAEMNAAEAAMRECSDLFPQLDNRNHIVKPLADRKRKENSTKKDENKRSWQSEVPERYKLRSRSRERSHSRSRSSSSSPNTGQHSPLTVMSPRRSSSDSSSPSPPRRRHRNRSRSSSNSISPPAKDISPGVDYYTESPEKIAMIGRNSSPPSQSPSSSVTRDEGESPPEWEKLILSKKDLINPSPPASPKTTPDAAHVQADTYFQDDFVL